MYHDTIQFDLPVPNNISRIRHKVQVFLFLRVNEVLVFLFYEDDEGLVASVFWLCHSIMVNNSHKKYEQTEKARKKS